MYTSFAVLSENHPETDKEERNHPVHILSNIGYTSFSVQTMQHIMDRAPKMDAIIIYLPVIQTKTWCDRIMKWKDIPIIWWCDRETIVEEACNIEFTVDGMLYTNLTSTEMHWALLATSYQYLRRVQWKQEKRQLLSQIEDRKWIERAKSVLCTIKNISEAEAYDVLRKQAMNERKRIVDVAISIVKVYELLQDQDYGGKRK
ncbi:ANTAR domain-containing response regulator [Longirhabdus pacifica]|uniref:ANTAR domain-containing response regulator n=1 Tax=Longirhabdus pacifica TaxID=2305227 RepID=UPI001008922E|nr:ANTAR domain-containing protein [Longirhabdus pacifica]